MKHACVAARIGEGKAPGEGNGCSIAKTSNAAIADSGCNPSGWHEFSPMALSKGPLLRITKPQDFLLALSKNRDSASRVSLRYGLRGCELKQVLAHGTEPACVTRRLSRGL